MTRVLVLIAARAGSRGLTHKNVRTLGGVPLLVRAVRLAAKSAIDDTTWTVAVSTEDTRYACLAQRAGAKVIPRPPELATDEARLIDVVLHAISVVTCDVVVLLSATTPLTRASDVRRAFHTSRTHETAVATVTPDTPASLRFTLDDHGHMMATSDRAPGRRQSESVVHRLNGALYVATPSWLRQYGRFVVPGLTRAVVMPTQRSIDIESLADLRAVRALVAQRNNRAPRTKI